MRHLHTIVCAAALACAAPASAAQAQDKAQPAQGADRFTNRDLLEMSAHERRHWINGFMVGASNALALRDSEAGRCMARWYFENQDEAFGDIESGLAVYPDERPVAVIFAYAKRACSNLTEAAD